MGFRNVSATNVQEGLFAINAAGYATSGTTFATAAVDTSVAGKIFKITLAVNTVKFYVQIGNGRLYVIG